MRSVCVLTSFVLLLAGCGSTSSDGDKTSYHPDYSSSYSSRESSASSSRPSEPRESSTSSSRGSEPRDSSPTYAGSSEPREASSASTGGSSTRGERSSSGPATADGEQPIGPVVEAPDGRKLVQLPSKGWICENCKRTYNSQGWCCGREMKATP